MGATVIARGAIAHGALLRTIGSRVACRAD